MNSVSKGHTFDVSLRLWHPTMTASEISRNLGIEPTTQRDADSITNLGYTKDMTYWTRRVVESGTGNLPHSLVRITEELKRRGPFLTEMAATGGRIELYIGLFLDGNVGELFPASLLGVLGELHIDLAIDIYGLPLSWNLTLEPTLCGDNSALTGPRRGQRSGSVTQNWTFWAERIVRRHGCG